MVEKKTGISRDLIIHPGETIADILIERGITQSELAKRTGVTPAYVSNVIAGKKDISAKFAFALEYALNVPKTFWINLQAHYDAELLEYCEQQTITEEERKARESLKDVVKYLRQMNYIPSGERKDMSILSLRKYLRISNLANLKEIVPSGMFRMADKRIDPFVMGAWILMCQSLENSQEIIVPFNNAKINHLINDLKTIMLDRNADIQNDIKEIMAKYGIDFCIVHNFKGAPVHGFISKNNNGTYRMVLTIRGAFADIFWFSLFHEIGHIVNGDVEKVNGFIDGGTDKTKEEAADLFARDNLLSPDDYELFVMQKDYRIEKIINFAKSQRVKPYIVIGRLQKEKILQYSAFADYKVRYKWNS